MKINVISPLLTAGIIFVNGGEISENQQKWTTQYAKQTHIIPPEKALLNTSLEPDLSEGFSSLYNGKNLDGWIVRGGNCTFEPSENCIIGTCVKGSPSTYLSTVREDYSDFVFSAEIKWEVDGNTGIMFLAQRKPSKKLETVYGFQCEMEGISKHRGWSGGIYGQDYGGWRYPVWLDAHKNARTAINRESWNRVTIKVEGSNIKTWVNSIPVTNWQQTDFTKGFFALQIHSGKKGRIHFRNIKIKEL